MGRYRSPNGGACRDVAAPRPAARRGGAIAVLLRELYGLVRKCDVPLIVGIGLKEEGEPLSLVDVML